MSIFPVGILLIWSPCTCLGGRLKEENTNALECSFILGQTPKLQDFNNIQILLVGHTFIYLTYCKLLILDYSSISGFRYTPFANSTFSVHYSTQNHHRSLHDIHPNTSTSDHFPNDQARSALFVFLIERTECYTLPNQN